MGLPDLKPGLSKSVQKKITTEDTALNFGSGALTDLLATPTLTALMIEAAVKTVDPLLPDRHITVGKSATVIHEQPTTKGMTVTVTANLIKVDNNRLTFQLSAFDELGEIGKGFHERYIVNYDKFMEKTNERCHLIKEKLK